MGVHFCGWCGKMSGGGFCEPCSVEMLKAETELDRILTELPHEKHTRAKEIINRLRVAEANCD